MGKEGGTWGIRTLKNYYRGFFRWSIKDVLGVRGRKAKERYERKDGPGLIYGGKRAWGRGKNDPAYSAGKMGFDTFNDKFDYWGYFRSQLEHSKYAERYNRVKKFLDSAQKGQSAVKLVFDTDDTKAVKHSDTAPHRSPYLETRYNRVICPLYTGNLSEAVSENKPLEPRKMDLLLQHVLGQLEAAASKTVGYTTPLELAQREEERPYEERGGGSGMPGEQHVGMREMPQIAAGMPAPAPVGEPRGEFSRPETPEQPKPRLSYSFGAGEAREQKYPVEGEMIFRPGASFNKGKGYLWGKAGLSVLPEPITLNDFTPEVQRVLVKASLLPEALVKIQDDPHTNLSMATVLTKEEVERERKAHTSLGNQLIHVLGGELPISSPSEEMAKELSRGEKARIQKENTWKDGVKQHLTTLPPAQMYAAFMDEAIDEKFRAEILEHFTVEKPRAADALLEGMREALKPHLEDSQNGKRIRDEIYELFPEETFHRDDFALLQRLREPQSITKLEEKMQDSLQNALERVGGQNHAAIANLPPAPAGAHLGAVLPGAGALREAYVAVLHEELFQRSTAAGAPLAWGAGPGDTPAIINTYVGPDVAGGAMPPVPDPSQRALVELDRAINPHAPVVAPSVPPGFHVQAKGAGLGAGARITPLPAELEARLGDLQLFLNEPIHAGLAAAGGEDARACMKVLKEMRDCKAVGPSQEASREVEEFLEKLNASEAREAFEAMTRQATEGVRPEQAHMLRRLDATLRPSVRLAVEQKVAEGQSPLADANIRDPQNQVSTFTAEASRQDIERIRVLGQRVGRKDEFNILFAVLQSNGIPPAKSYDDLSLETRGLLRKGKDLRTKSMSQLSMSGRSA